MPADGIISFDEYAELRGAASNMAGADAILDAVEDQMQRVYEARAAGVDLGTVCRVAVPVLDLLRALCSLAPSSSIGANHAGNHAGNHTCDCRRV